MASSTSTGIAAPAETHTRSRTRSRPASRKPPSMAAYVDGSASITVTPRSRKAPSADSASKRASRARQAPARTAALSAAVCPKDWDSANPASTTSSEVSCSRSLTTTSLFRSRLPCVSVAPRASPVTPAV